MTGSTQSSVAATRCLAKLRYSAGVGPDTFSAVASRGSAAARHSKTSAHEGSWVSPREPPRVAMVCEARVRQTGAYR
jgi:hypothetical protein